MISKQQAYDYFTKRIAGVDLKDKTELNKAFMDYMGFLAQNYIELDIEMKEVFDKSADVILDMSLENLLKLPDSIEKRKGLRLYKRAKGEQYDINRLVEILERPKMAESGIYKDTRVIFLTRMQNIIDFISDVAEHSFEVANDKYAIMGLYILSVDELLAAFHLSQHAFINQACSHVRTVLEILDKIELFVKEPKWADIWASNDKEDKKKSRIELKPSAVRIKLGRNKFDPLYSMLSELGIHSGFKSVQTRSGVENELNEKGNYTLRYWMGGCPFEHNIVFSNSFLLYVMGLTLFSITTVYEKFLLEDEIEKVLTDFMQDIKVYNENHFIPWAAQEGFDITPLVEMLKRPVFD